MSESQRLLQLAVDGIDAKLSLAVVRFVHVGCITHAANYPVCAHCSEMAGHLVASPCPTYRAAKSRESAQEVILAADRYRHFVLNGFSQEQWDEAARELLGTSDE